MIFHLLLEKSYAIHYKVVVTSGTSPQYILREGRIFGAVYDSETSTTGTYDLTYTAIATGDVTAYFYQGLSASEYTISEFRLKN